MAEKWLSIVEYARTYNVSDMTVRRRIKTGKLNAVLQDGKYFIPLKDESKAPPLTSQSPRRQGSETMQVIKAHPAPQHTFHPQSLPQHLPRHQQAASALPVQPRMDAAYEALNRHMGLPITEDPPFAPAAFASLDDDGDTGIIPASLRRAFQQGDAATVDARALLAFCEASMKKHQESERRQVERFKSKLETLEATVSARDGEIKGLKQQLEDLQLLVKVLERKRSGG